MPYDKFTDNSDILFYRTLCIIEDKTMYSQDITQGELEDRQHRLEIEIWLSHMKYEAMSAVTARHRLDSEKTASIARKINLCGYLTLEENSILLRFSACRQGNNLLFLDAKTAADWIKRNREYIIKTLEYES